MIGQTFGHWQVLKFAGMRGTQSLWACQCACGNIKSVVGASLRNGTSKSCCHWGARKVEVIDRTPSYKAWVSMRQRCNNPQGRDYARYGGRGIFVCPEWQNSFQQFLADMGPRPSRRHSVDRRDNDGPYHPDNCYWATPEEQQRNKKNTLFVDYQGVRQSLPDWADQLGIRNHTLYYRIKHLHWPVEKAFTKPVVYTRRVA